MTNIETTFIKCLVPSGVLQRGAEFDATGQYSFLYLPCTKTEALSYLANELTENRKIGHIGQSVHFPVSLENCLSALINILMLDHVIDQLKHEGKDER